jgi:Cu-processing system ATP-binding protein
MLDVIGLHKRYGTTAVLRGVDMSARAGRVLAVIGANGAGKTTLIKCVLGLARHDGGEIRLAGQAVQGDAYRARIGYMPQVARFPENLSGASLVRMVEGVRGASCQAGIYDRLVDRLELGAFIDQPLRTLSGGTRQKVNALLALVFAPEVLIFDEPTTGLDPISSGALKDEITRERAAGRAVILTSHITSELEELADDVLFLSDGRVGFAGSVSDLLRRTGQPRLERAVAALMRGTVTAARPLVEVA